jgi:hypothetical protein
VLSEEVQLVQVALLGDVVSLITVEDVATRVLHIPVDVEFMRDLLGQKVAVQADSRIVQEVLVSRHDKERWQVLRQVLFCVQHLFLAADCFWGKVGTRRAISKAGVSMK